VNTLPACSSSLHIENNRLPNLVDTFGENSWAEPLRYFMSKADGKAFTAFFNAFFNSKKTRDLNQHQQDFLLSLVREDPERPRPSDAFVACLQNKTTSVNQQRYALDCLKAIGGERVRKFIESFAVDGKGKQAIVAYAREIAAQLAAPALGEAGKKIESSLFIDPAASFRNPVEYNAEYIFIRGGTIKYSATKKVEKVPDLYFAKYPVTNKQYRRFIQFLKGDEVSLTGWFGHSSLPKSFWNSLRMTRLTPTISAATRKRGRTS